MALLEKERYKQHNMKTYAQAASIEEHIAAKRKEKRSLTEEMTKLQEEQARSKWYYRSKESSSENVKEKEQITKDKSASQLTLFQSGVKPKESTCNDDVKREKEDCGIVKVAHGRNEIVNEEKKSEEDSLLAHIVDDSTDVNCTAISMEKEIINNEKDIEEDKNTQTDVPFL